MGLETRNEAPEQQQEVEQNQEQETPEQETPEVSDSEVEDVDTDEENLDSPEVAGEQEQGELAEEDDDFSDVPEEDAKGEGHDETNAVDDTAAEDFAEPALEIDNTFPDDTNEIKVQDSEEIKEESSFETSENDAENNEVDSNTERDELTSSDESYKDFDNHTESPESDTEAKHSIEDTTGGSEGDESPKNDSPSEAIEQDEDPYDAVLKEEHANDSKETADKYEAESVKDELSSEESNNELNNFDYGPYTPEQIESHKGLESIAKEYSDKVLSDEDKKELSDRQYDYLKDRQPEDRDDCRVHTPESIKDVRVCSDGRYEVDQNWRQETDGAELGSREMEVVKAGSTIDRVGSGNGKYFSPMNDNGTPYSINERATGDRMVEDRIDQNSSYHQYEVKQDLSRENIESAIDKHYSGAEREAMQEELKAYYEDCCDPMNPQHKDDPYSDKPVDETDGIKAGKIDHMFTDNDGGGRQYIMPFSASEMCKMELIEEKQKQD